MGLRGFFWWNVVALGVLVMVGAGSMAVLATVMRTSSSFLERSMSRSAAAQRLESQLLLLDLQAAGKADRSALSTAGTSAEDLDATLDELARLVDSEPGRRLVAQLHEQVDAYLEARGTGAAQARQLEAALQGSRRVQELGREQAAAAIQRAAKLDRLGSLLAATMALLFVATAILSIGLMRRLIYRPLSDLTTAIGRFGKGERSSRAPPQGARELALIADTFNATADLVERQLISMASVAHDLRSPLNALGVAVGTIRPEQPLPDEEKLRRIATVASRQVTKLDRMIGDLLDAARMETGRIDLHLRQCDLSEVARGSLELFRSASSKHTLELSVPGEPVTLWCDPMRLEQALNNLVSNAIKYSPQGGKVQVELGRDAAQAWVAVSDEGIGIAADQRERIFEPFRRGGRTREEIPGVGLGLSITRRIVESHGGRLEFESTPGKGSTFRIFLPLAPTASEQS